MDDMPDLSVLVAGGGSIALGPIFGKIVEMAAARIAKAEARIADLEARVAAAEQVKFLGTWNKYHDYSRGNFVSRGGSIWHCDIGCRDVEPGSNPKYWTLAAKAGTDRGVRDRQRGLVA